MSEVLKRIEEKHNYSEPGYPPCNVCYEPAPCDVVKLARALDRRINPPSGSWCPKTKCWVEQEMDGCGDYWCPSCRAWVNHSGDTEDKFDAEDERTLEEVAGE